MFFFFLFFLFFVFVFFLFILFFLFYFFYKLISDDINFRSSIQFLISCFDIFDLLSLVLGLVSFGGSR